MTRCTKREATGLIVAALAGEGQHGCGIVARVRDISGGRVRLRAGTLFTVLDKLRADDLVRIDRDEVVDGRPRRYYRLSSASSGRPVEPVGLAARPDLRVSDADRDAAVASLCEHFAQGRLTAAELQARLDLALAAVTRRDLARANRDLPWQLAWPEGGGGDGVL
jgi:DUF1707 SHOCT-like domain/Transcriptional regulator PadR-like family